MEKIKLRALISERLAKPEKSIKTHTFELLLSARKLFRYGYIDKSQYKLLRRACTYHDYGKMNDEFQSRIKIKRKFNPEKELPHNVLSIFFIPEDKFENRDDYLKVCYSVLNHHHNVDNFEVISERKELIQEFIEKFELKKIKKRNINDLGDFRDNLEAQILKGYLHKCDYSASGDFQVEYPNDFLEKSMENLNYKWNKLQEFCIKNSESNIIVVANTGMGKTEAGLLWIGDNKGFFILPLRTAINAIYKRISEDIVKENIEERVALMHSDVLSYYLCEGVTEEDKVLEYIGKGKNLSMPLSISTLDQIFDFVYLYDGFEVKLSTLSYSKIVIDEIQAYSPYLLAYLIVGLKKITDVGGRFAILTATLPPFVKDCIEKEVGKVKYEKFTEGRDRHNIEIFDEKINADKIYDYYEKNRGKILVVCNTVKKSQEIYRELKKLGIENKNLNLLHSKFIKKDRLEKEKEILEFGKTENRENGIWVSTSLVEASLDIDFDFLFTELNDLNGFFQRLGRVNRKGLKSYELDGEVKKLVISKSPKLQYPNVFLYTEIENNLLIKKNGNSGFIDETIYNISKEAISTVKGKLTENEKVELIEKYLTSEKIADSNFIYEYRGMKNYISSLYLGEVNKNEVAKKFRDITSYTVIPFSIYENEKEKIHLLREIIMEKIEKGSLSFEEYNKLKNENRLKKARAQHELEQFTVSVGIYDLNKTGESIDLGFNKFQIVNCEYSSEEGFVRVKREKFEKEEWTDNFN